MVKMLIKHSSGEFWKGLIGLAVVAIIAMVVVYSPDEDGTPAPPSEEAVETASPQPEEFTVAASAAEAEQSGHGLEPGEPLWVWPGPATLYALPSADGPTVSELAVGTQVVLLGVLGPGRHVVHDRSFNEVIVDIPESDGEWMSVGVSETQPGGPATGWVRASDVVAEEPTELRSAREEAELGALLDKFEAAAEMPCETDLVFTKIRGVWAVKAPGTAALDVTRWFGDTAETYQLLKLVDELGDGRDVPFLMVLQATGEC